MIAGNWFLMSYTEKSCAWQGSYMVAVQYLSRCLVDYSTKLSWVLKTEKHNGPYSRYQPSLRAPWCCRENITVTWSLRAQTAGFAYVNKALLNSVFGNFQRSLKANSYFTVSYIYLSNIFYQDMGKKDRCAVYGCDNNRRYPDR